MASATALFWVEVQLMPQPPADSHRCPGPDRETGQNSTEPEVLQTRLTTVDIAILNLC
ncbi:MAG: hypothetical protein VKL01_09495 [Limnothrix sp.]|uniref:hypothetical protein n=1 Tax=unclassified Limnothrix TaxID=2632864 RepID=UPI000A71471C|nr:MULTISPECIES: hypothetical protein [unclassified Limnothrix]MBD2554698.1 hypothetical protein [Limnothrix sp. FACHB-708]MBD2591731.1 hypothetical protein [Limnothrix sp. FACHB-406]MBD2635721.1 hypothetical protein [Limnothrix sp. FACHB-881]MEB3118588.1 hypothetical protein [Limnothrix sp.]